MTNGHPPESPSAVVRASGAVNLMIKKGKVKTQPLVVWASIHHYRLGCEGLLKSDEQIGLWR